MVEVRRYPLPRHGTDHDSEPLPSFPRFCLPARPLQCRQEEYRSGRATAQGFGRSLLALPEIIQFSNQLSYDGAIRPLRDASRVSLKPHVIAHRVTGALSDAKVNAEEAEEVAALVLAATEQPEYADKTKPSA